MRHRDREGGRGQITGGLSVLGVGLLFLNTDVGSRAGTGGPSHLLDRDGGAA